MKPMERPLRSVMVWLASGSIDSITSAFCAGDDDVLQRISLPSVAFKIRTYLAGLPFAYFAGLLFLILWVDFALPPFVWKLRPMRFLPAKKQTHYLDTWARSRVSLKQIAYVGLRFLFLSRIYSEPQLLEFLGYGPGMKMRVEHDCQWEPV